MMANIGLVTCRRLLRLTGVTVRHCSGGQSVVRPQRDQRLGPDRVLPANSLTSTWPDGAVLIREHTDHESAKYPPKSVWTMLQVREDSGDSETVCITSNPQDTLARVPDRVALGVKRDGVWVTWTYKQYVEEVQLVAKAFIKLGLKRSHAVGIIGFNAPEWHISNIAAVVAGGLGTGIYTTNSPDAVRYVAEHSRANILVLENQDQLQKVESFRDNLEHLEAVVMFRGEPEPDSDVISWQQLLEVGRGVEDSVLQERLEQQAVNQPALLVYTSGTTGNPKGVMISQDSLTWTCRAAQEVYDWRWDMEEGITYLPLSHVAAQVQCFLTIGHYTVHCVTIDHCLQVIDIYLAAYGGATIWFADDKALQGTLINTLKEVRPTRFLGVPRVWEKIEEKMREIAKQNSGFKKAVANWAKAAAFEHHAERMAGRQGPNHF